MSLTKDISKFYEQASKKRDLSDQSKTCEDPKKMREDKSSPGSLTVMADDVFAESLKSPKCIEILFNCLRNVERQTKDIYTLANSTQNHQIKGGKQLIDLTELIFLSDKFREYEEGRAKKDKIIEDLKSEVDSLSTKIEKLEKLQDQQEQYSRRNCLLVHGIAEAKEEITDEVIINALNEKLDLEIKLRDIDRTHRIGGPKKTRGKTRPIIVKFFR